MSKIATPLRAEPLNGGVSAVYDANEQLLFYARQETAALIVAMSEDAKRLDWLNTVHGMDWLSHCDYGDATRQAIDKAALAAGGEGIVNSGE